MIKLQLDNDEHKIEYTLPTGFNEVNLSMYMKINEIDETITPLEKTLNIISILTEISTDKLREIKLEQVKFINNNLLFLFGDNKNENLLKEKVKIDGKWYGLNKNLNNQKFGETIDLDNFTKDINNNLHYIMAILYRPVKTGRFKKLENFMTSYIYNKEKYNIEEYDIETIQERAEIFKEHMNMDVVFGALFFFIILRMILLENTKKSMDKKEMMDMAMKKMKEWGVVFMENGD